MDKRFEVIKVTPDPKRGVVDVTTSTPELTEAVAQRISSFGYPGDISTKDIISRDTEQIGPAKVHSLSTIGDDKYAKIFGHTNFIGDKK